MKKFLSYVLGKFIVEIINFIKNILAVMIN